ncbi:MAG: cyclodeaminase/cyclohydrolase family protein [Termitinemataceae bacterium]|nr:MAG: cyclodeaminase/cyclohydrolase family protein [Termitinemataceae bacterium]
MDAKFIDCTLESFMRRLASSSPVPGGGTSAALQAALGVSLIIMVTKITASKPRYLQQLEELTDIAGSAEELQARFLKLADEDSAAYRKIMAARAALKAAPDSGNGRAALLREYSAALEPPLKILDAAFEGIKLAGRLAGSYCPSTASDVGIAARSISGAAAGAELTVLINLASVEDETLAVKLKKECEERLFAVETMANNIYLQIRQTLLNGKN